MKERGLPPSQSRGSRAQRLPISGRRDTPYEIAAKGRAAVASWLGGGSSARRFAQVLLAATVFSRVSPDPPRTPQIEQVPLPVNRAYPDSDLGSSGPNPPIEAPRLGGINDSVRKPPNIDATALREGMRRSVPLPLEESGTGKDIVRDLLGAEQRSIEIWFESMDSAHIVSAAAPERGGLAGLTKRANSSVGRCSTFRNVPQTGTRNEDERRPRAHHPQQCLCRAC